MKEVVFCKYNNGRSKQFQIKTIIYREADQMIVTKEPLCEEAKQHVSSLPKYYNQIKDLYKNIIVVPVSYKEDRAEFPYIEGNSLIQEEIATYDDIDRIIHHLNDVNERIFCYQDNCIQEKFEMTPKFKQIFGEQAYMKGACVRIANLDMIYDNLLEKDGTIYCLDYEWVFEMIIPINFLIYRNIVSFYTKCKDYLKNTICIEEFLARFGFDDQDQELLSSMEYHFQQYVYGEHMEAYYLSNYQKGIIPIGTIFEMNQQLQQHTKNLTNMMEHKDGHFVEQTKELETYKLHARNLQLEIDSRDDKIKEYVFLLDDYKKHTSNLTQEINRWKEQYENVLAQHDTYVAYHESCEMKHKEQEDVLYETIKSYKQEQIELLNQMDFQRGEIIGKQGEINQLAHTIQMMRTTYTWRVTKPLRIGYIFAKKVVCVLLRKVRQYHTHRHPVCLTNREKGEYPYSVSVVIPTYNGATDLKTLLPTLQGQKGVKSIEIIVVDSASKDETVEICNQYQVTVRPITQQEFSHSYARNLGASMASGDYILFMTQDALPSNEYWLYNMMTPIVEHGVTAVSCAEQPRENCELSYQIASEMFAKYLGVFESDKIGTMPRIENFETMRQNGQLNDIACLIDRKVFAEFQYQGDYAEDLDMGIRLIRSGRKIAILSSEKVVHSHNRVCGYHLKRATVDSRNLQKILPDFPLPMITTKALIDGSIFGYYLTTRLLDQLSSVDVNGMTMEQFFDVFDQTCGDLNQIQAVVPKELEFNKPYSDGTVDQYIRDLIDIYCYDEVRERSIYGHTVYYVNQILKPFVIKQGKQLDEQMKQDIIDAIFKKFVSESGSELSLYNISNPDNQVIQRLVNELKKGV